MEAAGDSPHVGYIDIAISTTYSDLQSRRKFPSAITLEQLRNRLEMVCGASATSMQLELLDGEGRFLKHLSDSTSTLADMGIASGMQLRVSDPTARANDFAADESVPKFELSLDEYAERDQSLLAFKRERKLGRFDEQRQLELQQQQAEKLRLDQERAATLRVGARCQVTLIGSTSSKRGAIRYVGSTHFKEGAWVGVQYDEPVGKNDGSVQGRRYFQCAPGYGAFVRPSTVESGDFPELALDEEMDEI